MTDTFLIQTQRLQTADEYMTEYNSRRGGEYSRFHGTLKYFVRKMSIINSSFNLGYTYDGIWAVAMAIQYVSQKKDQFLQNFQYHTKEWENIFLEALGNTSFEGVTVSLKNYEHFD